MSGASARGRQWRNGATAAGRGGMYMAARAAPARGGGSGARGRRQSELAGAARRGGSGGGRRRSGTAMVPRRAGLEFGAGMGARVGGGR
jgi:hypothetical protein